MKRAINAMEKKEKNRRERQDKREEKGKKHEGKRQPMVTGHEVKGGTREALEKQARREKRGHMPNPK